MRGASRNRWNMPLLKNSMFSERNGRWRNILLNADLRIGKTSLANKRCLVDSWLRLIYSISPCGLGCFVARSAITWRVGSSYFVVAIDVRKSYGANHWTLGCEPWVLHQSWRATKVRIEPSLILFGTAISHGRLAMWCFKQWIGLRRWRATWIFALQKRFQTSHIPNFGQAVVSTFRD